MTQMQGPLEQIIPVTTQFGLMHNIVVGGQKFGCGKAKPNANPGDVVSFTFTQKGNFKNVDQGTLQVVSRAGTQQVATGTSAVVSNFQGSTYGNKQAAPRNDYAASQAQRDATERAKQPIISMQAARNSANATVAMLIAADALPLGKTAKPADRFEEIERLVDHFTNKYYVESMLAKVPTESTESAKTGFNPDNVTTGEYNDAE